MVGSLNKLLSQKKASKQTNKQTSEWWWWGGLGGLTSDTQRGSAEDAFPLLHFNYRSHWSTFDVIRTTLITSPLSHYANLTMTDEALSDNVFSSADEKVTLNNICHRCPCSGSYGTTTFWWSRWRDAAKTTLNWDKQSSLMGEPPFQASNKLSD